MRFCWSLLIGVLLVGAARAESSSGALLECSRLTSDTERLACYDALAAGIVALPADADSNVNAGAQEEPIATTPPSAQAVHSHEELEAKYGKEHWQSEMETPDTISARVDAVRKNAYGKLVVSLDNKQVWRQSDSETVRIAVNDRIQIERGMLRSFFFRVNDAKRKIRFTRME